MFVTIFLYYVSSDRKLIVRLFFMRPLLVFPLLRFQEILFIYRNDKWDLPKGKIEKNESIEECAIREVWEETGVEDLKITKLITKTYHVFKRNGKLKLKETWWYEMHTSYTGELTPQPSEGIEKVKWKNFAKSQKALQGSYENIKLLFPKEYLTMHPNDRVGI
jgi:8-oxo-dGTP pyrophosphatase MutT (NUDIX family)